MEFLIRYGGILRLNRHGHSLGNGVSEILIPASFRVQPHALALGVGDILFFEASLRGRRCGGIIFRSAGR